MQEKKNPFVRNPDNIIIKELFLKNGEIQENRSQQF
jgi:hypothetical protein